MDNEERSKKKQAKLGDVLAPEASKSMAWGRGGRRTQGRYIRGRRGGGTAKTYSIAGANAAAANVNGNIDSHSQDTHPDARDAHPDGSSESTILRLAHPFLPPMAPLSSNYGVVQRIVTLR